MGLKVSERMMSKHQLSTLPSSLTYHLISQSRVTKHVETFRVGAPEMTRVRSVSNICISLLNTENKNTIEINSKRVTPSYQVDHQPFMYKSMTTSSSLNFITYF